MSTTFLLFCTLFIIAYGLQGALQAIHIRKYDALTVGVYRNLSLIITMMPVLLFVPASNILDVTQHLWPLFLASLFGALGLWMAFAAAHYLPIGVGTALRQMMLTTTAVLLGAFIFREFLEPLQLLFLGLAAGAGVALILSKIDYGHLNPRTIGRGIVLTLSAGVMVAFSFFYFSTLSRSIHPFAAAYFWESAIGLFLLVFFLIRAFREKLPRMPSRFDSMAIFGVALLTLPGTVGYSLAVTHGPFAIASGLMSLTTVVAIMTGRYLYHERLSLLQMMLIGAAVVSIVLLKVFS